MALAIFTIYILAGARPKARSHAPVRLAQYHLLYLTLVINENLNISSIQVESKDFKKHKLSISKYVDAVDLSSALG